MHKMPRYSAGLVNVRHSFALLLIVSCYGTAWSVDVTFEEARAAYVQNMLALKVFSCRVVQVEVHTADYFNVLEQRIAKLEAALPKFPSGNDRQILEREIAKTKDSLSTRELYPLHREASLMVGSHSIQIASPSRGKVAPSMPIDNQADLVQKCYNAVVLCWSPTQKPNSWMWQGKGGQADGVLYATIGSRRPQDELSFPVIPIGLRDPMPFEQRHLSPFDAFFDDGFTNTNVVNADVLNGEQVVVVERTYSSSKNELKVQASLSIHRNFFPVRIKWKNRTFVDVNGFHETPHGAYYPSQWTVTEEGTVAVRNAAEPQSGRYIRSVETWTVDDFRSDQPEPRLFSEIGFPEGTYCFDEDKQTYFTVGKTEEVVDAVLDGHPPASEDQQHKSGEDRLPDRPEGTNWLLWLNLAAILGIFSLLVARHLRQRRKD